MRFNNNEYDICDEAINDGGVGIFIIKEALEKWRDHYRKVASKYENEPFKWGFYMGKADVLIDMIKHFEEEGVF